MNSNSGTTLAITDMIRLLLEVYMAQGTPWARMSVSSSRAPGRNGISPASKRAQIRACSSSYAWATVIAPEQDSEIRCAVTAAGSPIWALNCSSGHDAPCRASMSFSCSIHIGSELTRVPSKSHSTARSRRCSMIPQLALKYLACGWCTTIASVDCSGCSCNSSESSTPMRSGFSRVTSFLRSSMFGHAG